MDILFYVFLGIAINVAILMILRMIGKNRPKMSYSDYLKQYGSVGPYNSSDASKFM
jgi:hypothetical protein